MQTDEPVVASSGLAKTATPTMRRCSCGKLVRSGWALPGAPASFMSAASCVGSAVLIEAGGSTAISCSNGRSGLEDGHGCVISGAVGAAARRHARSPSKGAWWYGKNHRQLQHPGQRREGRGERGGG